MSLSQPPAPGSRALIRDEEWLVQHADQCAQGGWQLSCIGVSETVRNRHALFLTALDDVTLIDPAQTELVFDDSPGFMAARLAIEARLRQSAVQGDDLVLGQQAVMDTLPFQLDPAHHVLQQLRPRLLIADTVGLGKTLEAGILSAELIRRGRARRILVVTTKSMMRQFQQEFWNRFTIALTRLDSAGIQRIRRQIPANHNPFSYYDRTIISVDTLKRDSEYRHYLESAWWDLIIIDEAHNVSYKGNRTQSNRLADLLAQRSDALILLTATPHNGKKESFASLVRMLDPTVLPPRADYTRSDVEHLFIRRFKSDVREQMKQDFPERQVFKLAAQASAAENLAFDALAELKLASDGSGARDGAMLFRTVLEKALFSSPAACLQTLKERIRRLEARDATHPDLASLRDLQALVQQIEPTQFSKLQHLIAQLKDDPHWRWDGRAADDRLVLFTERIETLKFLQQHLPAALGLKADAIAILHGQLPDQDIQQIVEDFGRSHSPLRLLIASDVASEGLNLHYQSHRLIHFDIPWSLMVFQQRNGRVDRYGQTQPPKIGYLYTQPRNERVRGDLRYLEILIEKDEQAAKNIGDPSAFMGLYDEDAETLEVAKAIEGNTTAEAFAQQLAGGDVDPFELLWGDAANNATPPVGGEPVPSTTPSPTATLPSLFAGHYHYARDGLRWLRQYQPEQQPAVQADDATRTLSFQPGRDLTQILERDLAPEMWPTDNTFALCADRRTVEAAIAQSRDGSDWPQLHYLWPLHPIAQWLDYKLMAAFGRQRAPLLRVPQGLQADEAIILVLAQVPNRRGQAMLAEWLGVQLDARGQVQAVLNLSNTLHRTGLDGGQNPAPANDGHAPDSRLWQQALPAVIHAAEMHLRPIKQAFDADCRQRLDQELTKLATLRDKHLAQMELELAQGGIEQVRAAQRQQRESATADLFGQYQQWVRDTLQLDDRAQFTVVAALVSQQDAARQDVAQGAAQ